MDVGLFLTILVYLLMSQIKHLQWQMNQIQLQYIN